MDWVQNVQCYGTFNPTTMLLSDQVFIPLTFQGVPAPGENTAPWAHFEDSPLFVKRIIGEVQYVLDEAPDSSYAVELHLRITKLKTDPVTQTPFLPVGAFYSLNQARDANDEFLWEEKVNFWATSSGFFDPTHKSPTYGKVKIDTKVGRKLEGLENIWLIAQYSLWDGGQSLDPGRLRIEPYLRTLLAGR